MTAHRARIRGPLALVLSILALAAPADALDAQAGESAVSRPLATRAELDAAAARLAREPGAGARSARAKALRRLTDGDFAPGALILLEVQGEPTLTDTFAVVGDGTLVLPSPAVGA